MKKQNKRPQWLSSWLSAIIEKANFSVCDIPFASSGEWIFRDGMLAHRTGKFFRVVGVAWENERGDTVFQPLLEQREIGMLGFLVRERDGKKEILVQAKIEPGNVGIVQLSPTCQATASNMSRVHGGATPPFADIFSNGSIAAISESLQSEQGSRFLGKFNRNVCAIIDGEKDMMLDETYRWLPVDEFLSLLRYDFLVNTDARSVLVCSPWALLASRTPFTRSSSEFSRELARSAAYHFDPDALEAVLEKIRVKRNQTSRPRIIPLENMAGWTITDGEIRMQNPAGLSVCHIAVRTKYREVPRWDQPIIKCDTSGEIILACGRIDGVLYFLFRLQIEPGLENLIELGPTEMRMFDGQIGAGSDIRGTLVAECRQSEEGGRFFQEENHYSIVDIGHVREIGEHDYWLTLAQIQELLKRGGWLTNEARSALSLLLPLL